MHQHGAATHGYKNFLNETMMVARALEMRGEHATARRLTAPFLASQGSKGLPGNFRTRLGVLYAASTEDPDPYTAQGYNMHHGFGLWAASEHYLWTRDAAYLAAVAPQLVQAADWVTRERQATRFIMPDGSRPLVYGLAPAGDLEDVEEYHYWYATDAYFLKGMKTASAALGRLAAMVTDAELKRRLAEEAGRVERDSAAFAGELRASLAESVALSPVVQLLDGSWVPYVPPRVHALTHRKEGWIREGLYPALHLAGGAGLEDQHPFVDWMIQDLEDNIFPSKESGYGLTDLRAEFFNLGGFTLQPNLLDLPMVYLRRDEVPNCLRGFYNAAAASLYPDTLCFAEWIPAPGQGAGPLYKTPDESKFIQWLRQLLILERGDALELGLGIPRAWMANGQRVSVQRAATLFGPLDLEITSAVAVGQIRAKVKLTPTEAPKAVWLRLRHPEGKKVTKAVVNGRSARVDATRQLVELPATRQAWDVIARFD
jgi:hypothetical protein